MDCQDDEPDLSPQATRQLYRGVANLLAGALEGEGRDAFLADAERRINKACPAPGRASMRAYLTVHTSSR
jgi:hypothetical protein